MSSKQDNRCLGPLSRRNWIQLGGLSMGAFCADFMPSDSLIGKSQAAETRRGPTDANGEVLPHLLDDFSVILFWANGGPSHIDLFDMKPEAPSEYRGPLRPISTNVNGLEICELMPKLSQMADKYTIVRSLFHERAEHSGGTNRFLTGYPSIAANLPRSEFPDMGSVVAKHLDDQTAKIP